MKFTWVCLLLFSAYLLGGYTALMPSTPQPKPRITQAVAFVACGSPAGILIVASDGTTAWFRPPYEGLKEATAGIADDAQFSVDYCPEAL